MSSETPNTAPKQPETAALPDETAKGNEKRGVLLGLTSAIAYSATNLALRELSDASDVPGWDIWVSAMKAIPTLVASVFLLLLRGRSGRPFYPSYKVVGVLFLAALLMQFGGNLCFQIALRHAGLAISVPFVFALIIFAGAFFGRLFVGDTVSGRTIAAIGIMAVSVVLLSYDASVRESDPEKLGKSDIADGENVDQKLSHPVSRSRSPYVQFGIFIAAISGLSYGVNGIVIRSLSKAKIAAPAITLVYSLTGMVCLGILGINVFGVDQISQISGYHWGMILVAGILNAIAFFALTNSLRHLDISRVNVINASQNAMCATGAFLVFAEPMTGLTVSGIALSIFGLMILGGRRGKSATE